MIDILNRQSSRPVRPAVYRRLLAELARRCGVEPGADVTLVFAGDALVRTLNRAWRGLDRPTDVLSFPMNERTAEGRLVLGDIVIAVPYAERQARRAGRTLERELKALVIHGFLHLAGWRHGRGIEGQDRKLRAALGAG